MGSISLPVSAARPAASAADLVRLFHRAQLQRARAIAEETVLDGSTWLHNPDLQPLPDANCVLDAAIDPGSTAAELMAEVDRLSVDCPVRGWTVNPSLPRDRTNPLVDHLTHAGWVPHPLDVLHLSRVKGTAGPVASLTVIPARAAYGPLRRLMDDRFGDRRADATIQSIDDPHLDVWLALRNGGPVAVVSLLNDGEVGTVTDLFVVPSERKRGIGRLLLGRAFEASGRSGHRHVLAGVEPGRTGLFAAVGFETVGQWVRYERDR